MQILQNIWTALTTENEGFVALINIPLSFIEAYISMLIFTSILNISASRKQKIIYVILLSSLACFIRFIIPDPYGTFINFIAFPIFVIILFKTSLLKAFSAEIIPIFLFGIIDYILMKFLNSSAGASESEQKTMDSTAITNFNMQFVNKGVSLTSNVTVTGSQALALQQAVLASNAVNKTHQISGNVTSTEIVISKKYYIYKPGTKDGYINKIDFGTAP